MYNYVFYLLVLSRLLVFCAAVSGAKDAVSSESREIPVNVTYPLVNIENRCGEVITIPCPTITEGRAGTLRFATLPTRTCEVTVELQENCTNTVRGSFALYLNIRQISTLTGHVFKIEETFANDRTVGKQLTNQFSLVAWRSIAQYLTRYSQQPRVHLVYDRSTGTSVTLSGYVIVIDYTLLQSTIIQGSVISNSTYCRALNGYIHNELYCPPITTNSRINCPSIYVPSLGENPTSSAQCDTPATARPTTTTRRPTTTWQPFVPITWPSGISTPWWMAVTTTTQRSTTRTTTRTTTRARPTTTWRPFGFTTTAIPWWRTTTWSWNWHYTTRRPDTTSTGELVAIVVSVVITALVGICGAACRHSRYRAARARAAEDLTVSVAYEARRNAPTPVVIRSAREPTAPDHSSTGTSPYPAGSSLPHPSTDLPSYPAGAGQPLPYPAAQPLDAPPTYAEVVSGAHPVHHMPDHKNESDAKS
ncbi:uncharacterized protein LOC129584322 [Paramacrobiotus metropolitanus]|uniref:uncharacterized protein LOC129584322 n=1 Tax=Paramacrobiotus metropolitanus TaxID=2943436 RepID=UPI00244562A8|nr:uncharacterized protein LOC129584322 [Paramacrobiotus metropolitanus]